MFVCWFVFQFVFCKACFVFYFNNIVFLWWLTLFTRPVWWYKETISLNVRGISSVCFWKTRKAIANRFKNQTKLLHLLSERNIQHLEEVENQWTKHEETENVMNQINNFHMATTRLLGNASKNCDWLASHQGEGLILLVASCWVPCDGLASGYPVIN